MQSYSRIVGVEGVENMGLVDSRAYRSAAPSAAGYESLREMGIRTVVNLQWESAAKKVETAGMKEFHFPLCVLAEIPVQKMLAITAVVASPFNSPALVHCRQGHDRTGAVCMCYRLQHCGWSMAEAREEAEGYGFIRELIAMTRSVEAFAKWLDGAKN